jgi:hypothetical protein
MSLTLKQIITRLEELAISHRQIHTFFLGAADEFLDNPDVVYPALFIEVKPESIASLEDRTCYFDFTMYFFDQINTANKSMQNILDITSDMSSIAQDYLALLNDLEYTDWEVSRDYSLSIKEYQLQDLTLGVSVDVNIATRFDANRCQVPNDFVFTEYNNSYITLKQVVERISKLALSHKQINNFYNGRFDQFLDGKDIVYPSCFLELNENGSSMSTIDRSINYNFRIYLFDLISISNNSLLNEWEVKSDMMSVALDIIAMLNYHGFEHSWSISSEYGISIKDYQLQDLVGGISFSFNISTRYDANLCYIPSYYTFSEYKNSNLTLKQVFKRIQDIVTSHKQINYFEISNYDKFLDTSDIIYPSCYAVLDESGSRISLDDRLVRYRFTFYFFDLLNISNKSFENAIEIKSDLMSICADVLSMLNYTGFQHSWVISDNYDISIKDFQLQDLTTSVFLTLEIGTRFDANKCQVPLEIENFLLWNDTDKFLINAKDKLILS